MDLLIYGDLSIIRAWIAPGFYSMKCKFSLVCLHCGKTYKKKYPYGLKRMRSFRFCGNKCSYKHGNAGRFANGHSGLVGAKNKEWKGDKAGYKAIHEWVRKRIKKSGSCAHCAADNRVIVDKLGRSKSYLQLANLSGEYRRDITDWTWLCPRCHYWYDKGRDSIRKVFEDHGRAMP